MQNINNLIQQFSRINFVFVKIKHKFFIFQNKNLFLVSRLKKNWFWGKTYLPTPQKLSGQLLSINKTILIYFLNSNIYRAMVIMFNTTIISQQYFSYIVAVSFIGGECPKKTTDLQQDTDKLYHIMLYQVHITRSNNICH